VPSLAGASRYARSETAVPDALSNPAGFVDAVAHVTATTGARVLLPITDPALLALLPLRDRFPGVLIPFPDAATYRRVADKELVLAAGAGLGLATPAQVVLPDRRADVQTAKALRFPLVLKPHRSVASAEGRAVKLGVRHARTLAELEAAVRELPDATFPLLLQERIVGPGVGVFLLLADGRRMATFCHRRLLEKPPSGGVSVRAESVPPDPDLVAQAERLLRHFGWTGVAMVEFKRDSVTGTPYLMEVNGRFWGSLQLAIDAGVDFPRLLLSQASGASVAPVEHYRVGVRRRWWWGEVDHLLARLRRRPESLALPPDIPSRVRVAADLLTAPFQGVRGEVLRVNDPAPALRETLDWFRGR
jgi:predicted ATP-grasp superfamily ATP-dependent carboligase